MRVDLTGARWKPAATDDMSFQDISKSLIDGVLERRPDRGMILAISADLSFGSPNGGVIRQHLKNSGVVHLELDPKGLTGVVRVQSDPRNWDWSLSRQNPHHFSCSMDLAGNQILNYGGADFPVAFSA